MKGMKMFNKKVKRKVWCKKIRRRIRIFDEEWNVW